MNFELAFNPVFGWPVSIMLMLGMVAFSFWTYPPGTPTRRWLLTLRTLAIVVAFLAMARPNLIYDRKQKQPSTIVVLADKSKSMLLKDMWADQTRWEALARLMQDSQPAIDAIKDTVTIKQFSFGRKMFDGIDLNGPPNFNDTAIGDALESLQSRLPGERLAGVILLSDGANTAGTAPSNAARQLAATGVPIYSFGFGQSVAGEQIKDIAALSINTNPVVFAKNKAPIRAEFGTTGLTTRLVNTKLLLNGVEEKKATVELNQANPRMAIELIGTPMTPGDIKVTIETEVQSGELLPNNNSISTYMQVLAGGINVLQLEGKYRFWEPKYVRWALDQSPDIDLRQEFVLQSANRAGGIDPELIKPGRFDVILLGDIPVSQFKPEQLTAIRNMVDRGAGLLMMGGYQSFGPGGWGNSPLADVLPVMCRAADIQVQGEVQFIPTEAGLRHYILRQTADAQASLLLWKGLRPLDGSSAFAGIKPNASILAQSATNTPLLVEGTFGQGRVLALAPDTSWRWRRTQQGQELHARFWRQLILWLAKKDQDNDARITLRLERRRVAVGEPLPAEIRVEASDGKPIAGALVTAVLQTPDGKEIKLDVVRQNEQFVTTIRDTNAIGDYTVKVTATDGANPIGERDAKFLTFQDDSELRQVVADHSALQALSKATGGEFQSADKLPEFFKSLKERDLNQEVSIPTKETLWDRWELFIVFCVLLIGEWILRKQSGLV